MIQCTPSMVEVTRDVVRQQLEAWDALDTKACFLFGAILVAVGLLLGRTDGWFHWLGLFCWLAAILVLLIMLIPRVCGQSPSPSGVLKYLDREKTEEEVMYVILCSMARIYDANCERHKRRVRYLRAAFILTVIGLCLEMGSFALAA